MFRSAYLTRTDRLRFFKSYLSENPNLAAKWKELAAKVHNKTDKRLKAKNRSVTVR
jgi:hypothetical protein